MYLWSKPCRTVIVKYTYELGRVSETLRKVNFLIFNIISRHTNKELALQQVDKKITYALSLRKILTTYIAVQESLLRFHLGHKISIVT